MPRLGCLLLVVLLSLVLGEIWLALKIAWRFEDNYLAVILLLAGMTWLGIKLAAFHARKLMADLFTGDVGSRMVAVIGALLLVFPGFATGALGLLLQIPLIRKPFAKFGALAAVLLMKRGLGGKGGMPGGLGGFSMFAGGFGNLRPDDSAGFPKPTRTVDTTAERVDRRDALPPPGTPPNV
jgi:UPF0716 family protein affecting phage T7 exclusion